MTFSSKITIYLIVLVTIYNNIIIESWAKFESTNHSLVIDLSDSSTESEEPSNQTTTNTTISSFGTQLTTNETIDKNWTQTIITNTTESQVIPNKSYTHRPLVQPEEEFGRYFGVSLLICAILAFLAMVWFVCRVFVQSLNESDEQMIKKTNNKEIIKEKVLEPKEVNIGLN